MRRNAKNKAASGLAACDMQIKKAVDGAKIGKNFKTGTD